MVILVYGQCAYRSLVGGFGPNGYGALKPHRRTGIGRKGARRSRLFPQKQYVGCYLRTCRSAVAVCFKRI